MRDHTLKSILAIFFILAQFVVVGSGFYYWREFGGFEFDEAMDSALMIAPVTAAYAAVMMRYVFFPPPRASQRKRSLPYVILSLTLFGMFTFALFMLANFKAYSGISFDQYKRAIAAADTIFAIYLSQIVASLFEGDRPGE